MYYKYRKPRTLNQLVERIAARKQRLAALKSKLDVPSAVEEFEHKIIASLQHQYDSRVKFMLQCMTFKPNLGIA